MAWVDTVRNTHERIRPIPRVWFIWDCVLRTDPLAILAAVAAFFFIGVPFLFVTLNWLHSTPFHNHSLAFPFSFVLCFGVGGGIVLAVGKLMHRRKRARNRFRVARLERFLKSSGARVRFPHRFVEYHHFSLVEKSGGLKKHLAKIAPGEIIVVGCPRNETDWRVRRSQSVFEPIPWGDERMLWLLTELAEPNPETEPEPTEAEPPVSWRSRASGLVPLLIHLFLVVIGIRALIKALMTGQTAWIWVCGIVLVLLAFTAVHYLIIGRQYFLVPGGLVQLETGLLYRTPRLELFTPRNSALMLYAEGGAFVASQGKVRFLESDALMAQCLLLAWLNEARTPTMDELRTLLAPECVTASPSVRDA